jgi:osmoprotectant transport system permease protein
MFLGVATPRFILQFLLEHLWLVGVACGIAFPLALILGIWVTRPSSREGHVARYVTQFVFLGQAVPSLAVIGLVMAVLGTGEATAIFALTIYSLVPMVRNVVEGLRSVDAAVLDAARGIGMAPLGVLVRVELPLALPVIFAGLRTAVVITIGTAALSSQVGGGGLGRMIFTGLSMMDTGLILSGAVPTALLAIFADKVLGLVERRLRGSW